MATPPLTDEEARAQLWRDQRARRFAYQRTVRAALAGDPTEYTAFMAGWQPLIDYLDELKQPPTDPYRDPDVDPFGISGQVNVGR